MLETIREFGCEKWVEAGELEGAGQHHRDYYLSLAEEAAPHLNGPGQAAWQKRLEREHDNLRAALEWSLTSAEGTEAALRLVGALGQFWVMGSHLREGREWATRALIRGRNASPLVLARALEWGHSFAFWQGDYAESARLGAEALHFARKAGDRERISTALFLVAIVAVHCSELEAAQASAEECIALAQTESNRLLIGRHQVLLSLIAWMQGNYAAARTLLREAVEISRALGEEWHLGLVLAQLGFVSRGDGDCEAARALHREGLPLCGRLGDRRGIGWHLVGMAGVEGEQGRAERAARLLGAAAAALEAIGSPLPPPQQREHDRTREQTEAALGEVAFAAAWAEGRAMGLEEAVACALASGNTSSDPDG
jgi:tetratricopeptide (TPR) repeat protein